MRYNKESFVKALREKYDEPFEIIEFNGTSKKAYSNADFAKNNIIFIEWENY